MHHCMARPPGARHEAIPLSEHSTLTLILYLVLLLLLVAFFAGTEVALLTVNRYRLRNRAARGDRAAKLAERLTRKPDRWLGVNLLWITLTTMAAPTVGTLLAQRYGGDALVWATTIGLGLFTKHLFRGTSKDYLWSGSACRWCGWRTSSPTASCV